MKKTGMSLLKASRLVPLGRISVFFMIKSPSLMINEVIIVELKSIVTLSSTMVTPFAIRNP